MDNTTRRPKVLDQGNIRNVQVVSAVAGMFGRMSDPVKAHTPPETTYTESDKRQLYTAERRRERKRQRNLRNLHNQTHKGRN